MSGCFSLRIPPEITEIFLCSQCRKLREIEELADIQKEYQFLVQHCTRKSYQLQFAKCNRDSCNHCRSSPVRAEKYHNYILPTPSIDHIHRGHFNTMLQEFSTIKARALGIDKGLPSLRGKSAPLCPFGCKYVFSSKADADRHCRLMSHNSLTNWRSRLPNFK